MSNTQDDTDPQPTPGPWEVSEVSKATVVADRYGTETAIANSAVYQTSEHDVFEENLANAELIAAAGTAAHEAAEMGYDSQKAVEALPNGLDAARRAILDLQDAHTDGPPEDTAEAAAQAAAHRLKVFMAEAGADESMIPGDASVALASAEGSGDE